MTEQPIDQQLMPNGEVSQEELYRDSVLTKVDVAWGSNVGDQGFADPYEVAARAYDALYRPDEVASGMDERARDKNPEVTEDVLPSHKLRPSTREVLTTPLSLSGSTPEASEFVPVVVKAILHSADVASTVLPGAREQIKELAENGDRPAVWSAGYPEHQHRKLGKTGLFDTVAIEGMYPPVEVTTEHGEPIEVLTAIATDKTTAETIARVREIAGEDQIIVVDDRVKNLRKFTDAIPETKAAIWAQYGSHAQKEMDKLSRNENPQLAEEIAAGRIIPIASIDQLTSKVAELRDAGVITDEQAAVFFDYDDTISNNTQRRDMELAAAVDAIFDNGWA
jgi:hypothetical protein